MKRTKILSLLMVLGLALASLPKAIAQDADATNETAKPKELTEAEVKEILLMSLTALRADAAIGSFKKTRTAGTNDIYTVQFISGGAKMKGDVATDGTVLEIEEPGNIASFPPKANAALRKAITGVGVKDLGVKLANTYAELKKDENGDPMIVPLPTPLTSYRADVQNNRGQPGKFSFTADGALLEKPGWAQ